jgi:hypothetical protein
MEKAERKRILAVWGPRDENARERHDRLALERDLEGSPLVGRPLARRLRNFKPAPDSYIASLGGPLPYMQRLRAIDELTERHETDLFVEWRELAEACGSDAAAFARRWRARAERADFTAVNDLIAQHNRWFPAESRLPMDPRRRDFALVNGKPYQRRPLDAEWVLDRFPAELEAAVAA